MKPLEKYLTFIRLPSYEQSLKGRLTDEDEQALEKNLIDNPEAGSLMVAGIRKVRLGIEGKGKRGSARVIYYYRSAYGRIYLLYVYTKNEADNLTSAGKKQMKELVEALERER